MLRLTGADRVDFLQRMTTNNILALQPGGSCVTVLTSPTAKIVQVFTVLARPEDLLLLPAEGETAALERHLRSQIFFMDQVEVANVGADRLRFRLMGPQAGRRAGRHRPGSRRREGRRLAGGGWRPGRQTDPVRRTRLRACRREGAGDPPAARPGGRRRCGAAGQCGVHRPAASSWGGPRRATSSSENTTRWRPAWRGRAPRTRAATRGRRSSPAR